MVHRRGCGTVEVPSRREAGRSGAAATGQPTPDGRRLLLPDQTVIGHQGRSRLVLLVFVLLRAHLLRLHVQAEPCVGLAVHLYPSFCVHGRDLGWQPLLVRLRVVLNHLVFYVLPRVIRVLTFRLVRLYVLLLLVQLFCDRRDVVLLLCRIAPAPATCFSLLRDFFRAAGARRVLTGSTVGVEFAHAVGEDLPRQNYGGGGAAIVVFHKDVLDQLPKLGREVSWQCWRGSSGDSVH
mmetsp:Transcript_2190/g.5130  ORF Transcript_2190/g.5130 Transcript_2190/m.5130 type:complete len:236 (-) Transcript_2190:773-1480(-)